MRKKEEILKALQGIKLCLMAHPDNEENSEFEIRINQIEEIEESIPKYADEFACAFAEFIAENYVPILQHQKLQYWQKNYQDKSKKYTTTELLEIFKQQINGKG